MRPAHLRTSSVGGPPERRGSTSSVKSNAAASPTQNPRVNTPSRRALSPRSGAGRAGSLPTIPVLPVPPAKESAAHRSSFSGAPDPPQPSTSDTFPSIPQRLGSVSAMSGASNVQVVCRFRPAREVDPMPWFEMDSRNSIVKIKLPEKQLDFSFDKVWDAECSQEDVYSSIAQVVGGVLEGFNGTLFTYGQTSSGKTHTMQGIPESSSGQGIIPRAMQELFGIVEKLEETFEFTFKCQYIEIYCERIKDLLEPEKDNLKIREDKTDGVVVGGATEVYVTSSAEVFKVTQKDTTTGHLKKGKLVLVDLAGSERISKTGAEGMRLEEAKNINRSLTTLGMVIQALSDGVGHVPYRDSKLTRLLEESLGGNSRTCLIICCAPELRHSQETISTLRFGDRAKRIKNKLVVNEELSPYELKLLLSKATEEIMQLKAQLQAMQSAPRTSNVPELFNTKALDGLLKQRALEGLEDHAEAETAAMETDGGNSESEESGSEAEHTDNEPAVVGENGELAKLRALFKIQDARQAQLAQERDSIAARLAEEEATVARCLVEQQAVEIRAREAEAQLDQMLRAFAQSSSFQQTTRGRALSKGRRMTVTEGDLLLTTQQSLTQSMPPSADSLQQQQQQQQQQTPAELYPAAANTKLESYENIAEEHSPRHPSPSKGSRTFQTQTSFSLQPTARPSHHLSTQTSSATELDLPGPSSQEARRPRPTIATQISLAQAEPPTAAPSSRRLLSTQTFMSHRDQMMPPQTSRHSEFTQTETSEPASEVTLKAHLKDSIGQHQPISEFLSDDNTHHTIQANVSPVPPDSPPTSQPVDTSATHVLQQTKLTSPESTQSQTLQPRLHHTGSQALELGEEVQESRSPASPKTAGKAPAMVIEEDYLSSSHLSFEREISSSGAASPCTVWSNRVESESDFQGSDKRPDREGQDHMSDTVQIYQEKLISVEKLIGYLQDELAEQRDSYEQVLFRKNEAFRALLDQNTVLSCQKDVQLKHIYSLESRIEELERSLKSLKTHLANEEPSYSRGGDKPSSGGILLKLKGGLGVRSIAGGGKK